MTHPPFVYLVEFACLLCGRIMFTARSASPTALIQPPPRGTRCSVCGGVPIRSGDITRRDAYREPPVQDITNHRGRPTKAVVDARRAAGLVL